jgi:NADPH:quinone reductase-like Zn-dependent oxidoreductase
LTSSSQSKLERAKGLLEPLVRNKDINAIQTIEYSKIDSWDQEAKKLNGGKGVDFVIEIGGRGTIGRSIRSTKPGGLVAVSGYVSTFKSIDDAVLKEGKSPHHPYGSGIDDRPGSDHSVLCSKRPRSLRLQQRRLQNNGISPRDWWCEANYR